MLDFSNISKSYGSQLAVDGISFHVDKGERFGLVGPDGAGKSTLIRILATLLLPDSGTATFDNRDVVKEYRYIRKYIGYMPGTFSLYNDLSVDENLQFYAKVFNTTIHENYHMIKDIYEQLQPFRNRRAGALSGGMKQKLALCCALVHKPKAMLLDEPTTGVDAVSRKEFWEMLGNLESVEITVLVSTSYMDEAAQCHRVALMQEGSILSTNTPECITNSFPKELYRIKAKENYNLLITLRNHFTDIDVYPCGEYLHMASDKTINFKEMHAFLNSKGFEDTEISVVNPDIEDCFIELMNRQKTVV